MNKKHAIVIALSFVLVGMMFFPVHVPMALEQQANNLNINPQQEVMQPSDGPVPHEPLRLNVIENPSFEVEDPATSAPDGWVAQSSAYQYSDDMYTGTYKNGNYGGLIEGMGGKTSFANSYIRTTADTSTAFMQPGISLSFNWYVIQNNDLSLGSTAHVYIQTTNSTGFNRYMYYYLSHGTQSLANQSNQARFLMNDTIGQWNNFDRNITEDYLAVFGPSDLSDDTYLYRLWFYSASPTTATDTLRYTIDDVLLYNASYSGWLPNGDFELGDGSEWSFYNTAMSYVEQSTESTHGTYSLNISQPVSPSGYGYGRLYMDFPLNGVYLGQEPGMNVISFDWMYNDTFGVGSAQYAYFRLLFQNVSNYYIHLYLGQNGDAITNVNSTNNYHIELPGFGTRETWQHAEFDLYDLLSEFSFLGTHLVEIRFEFTNSYSNAEMEILVDDFKMMTYPAADPGFEYDNYPGAVSPHLGWRGSGSTYDVFSKTTDAHSGNYANNMTTFDGEDAIIWREFLYIEFDSGLFTDFWWRLDDVTAGLSGYSMSYIEISFSTPAGNRYIRYMLANNEYWTPTDIANYKYIYADGFNTTGIWTRMYRNITADIISKFTTTPTDWIINGIRFQMSSEAGMRTSLIFDDINFIDANPPTVDTVTYDSTPMYYEDVLVRVSTTDVRPGVATVFVIYTTDGWSSAIDVSPGVWDQGDWYNATIPAQAYDTQVEFFVQVTDGNGVEQIEDNGGLFYLYTVDDDVAPTLTIDTPIDMAEVESLIHVNVTASDPGSGVDWVQFYVDGYVDQSDSIAPYSYAWQTDQVPLGMYKIEVTVRDVAGHTYMDSINVTIVDTQPPVTSTPADQNFDEGTTGRTIVWDPGDPRPNSFDVLRDGVSMKSGSWNSSSETITVSLDGLAAGEYNYTCVLYDDAGNSFADTVIITVNSVSTSPTSTTTPTPTDSTTPTSPPPDGDPLGLILVVAGVGGALVVIIIVVMLKKKK